MGVCIGCPIGNSSARSYNITYKMVAKVSEKWQRFLSPTLPAAMDRLTSDMILAQESRNVYFWTSSQRCQEESTYPTDCKLRGNGAGLHKLLKALLRTNTRTLQK